MTRVQYSEWGDLLATDPITITHGFRSISPQNNYTGHEFDDVLGMYYAKNRMYDQANRRFTAMDQVKGSVVDPQSLVPYVYVVDNPLRWIDPLGLIQMQPPQRTTIYINGIGYQGENKNGTTYFKSELDAKIVSHRLGILDIKDWNESPQMSVRELARLAGLENQLSWWKEDTYLTNVVMNSEMENSPVQLIRHGADITITAYIKFLGNGDTLFPGTKYTYNEHAAIGIKSNWSGDYERQAKPNSKQYYDRFGLDCIVHVQVDLYSDHTSPKKVYFKATHSSWYPITIDVNSNAKGPFTQDEIDAHIPRTWRGNNEWGVDRSKGHMYMASYDLRNSKPYTEKEFQHTVAHEFGHVLGLGDAYGSPNRPEAPESLEIPGQANSWLSGDMMRDNGYVTSNDIEMVLEAWKTNDMQGFVNGGGFTKSNVIRL